MTSPQQPVIQPRSQGPLSSSLEKVSTLVAADFDLILFFRRMHTLIGHRGEISNAQFNFDSSFIVTGSMVYVTC